jgi:dTDP-glucose 4,6-dehydratase/UDP-glucuronate decarboxylase
LPERTAHLQERPEFTFLRHNVSTPMEITEPAEWIIHGACIASPSRYRQAPLETIDVNVNGTRHMLDYARRGARSMLFMSTSEVYGDPDSASVPTPETYVGRVAFTGPRACYDESKRLGETLCTIYHRNFGIPVKMIRPFNVYGPGQRLDDKRLLPDMISAALEGRNLVLHSDGSATRSFCYLRDEIRGIVRVLFAGQDGVPVNVGDDREITVRELAETVARQADPPQPKVLFDESTDPDYLVDNPQRRCPDLTRLRGLKGWQPTVALDEGIARTLKSYRDAPP